ncbi:hypothetical protein FS749_008662 [Ceratobasidium sp. UAMH 11750]|nr:hypothetical protein FS749_008662 [Ceratobasidium sp. UAMH 11750]
MFTRFTALSVLGALATLGTAEASLSTRNSSKSCQNNYFWYDRLGCCLKNGGESTTPPSGSSCPSNLYWHTTEKCCVPKSSDTSKQIPSSCPNGSNWDTLTWCCKSSTPPSTTTCGAGFWWGALNMCVSIGGTGDKPPSGYSCPDSWSWLSNKSCCKPNQPTAPSTPSCGNSWLWHPGKQCCIPGGGNPTPSNAPGHYGRKRMSPTHKRQWFCPSTHQSCPILPPTKRSTEYECIDTSSELKSCGGCVSAGQGQDCLAIPNVKVVTCKTGQCVVEKCKPGYKLGADGASCVAALRAML